MNLLWYLFEKSGTSKRIAIQERDVVTGYPTLYNMVRGISESLREGGHGGNIMVVSDNSVFLAAAYLGIIGAGRTAVPLNPRTGKEHFLDIVDVCGIRTAFVQEKYLGKFPGKEFSSIENIYTESDVLPPSPEDSKRRNDPRSDFVDVDERNTEAVLVYTSGSTGKPKGVRLSHRNIMANTQSILEYFHLGPEDRMMVVLHFSYCYGASLLHTHLRAGGELVLNNRFMFPGKVLAEMNEKKCTGFAGVPSHFQILLRKTRMKEQEFPYLKYVAQAGGKLPVAFIRELKEALPGKRIFIMYGQTEATARLSYLPPEILEDKMGSIGKGIPGVELRVLDKEGRPVEQGRTGEIVAKGDNIMMGYWKDPEGTREVLREGWLHTGDLATVDEDGYLYITEREKDIIKSGGFQISPKEIEDVIVGIPQVVEAAVIGVEDDLLGEAIKAYVTVANPEQSSVISEDVIRICGKRLPSYKIPRYVKIVPSLPKNDSGKILKEKLKKMEHRE